MSSIKLISQEFFPQLASGSVDYLLGNKGDKIRVETEFSVQNYAVSSVSNPFIIDNTDGTIGDGWIFDPTGQFHDFKVGDTIFIFVKSLAAGASYTITDKKDDSNICVGVVIPAPGFNYALTDGVISVSTPITAVKYHFGFIENSAAATFLSKLDGTSEQEFIIKSKLGSDTSFTQMLPLGSLQWQDGLAGSLTKDFAGSSTPVCKIQGVSIDNGSTDGVYKTTYKIVHYTKIPPYITIDQTSNEIADIPPLDFKTINKCWKFISLAEAAENYTDPNFIVSDIFENQLGNTGWNGENFNTGTTNYGIASLVYKDPTGATIPSIGLSSAETTITFVLENTIDTPFTSSGTPGAATQFVVEIQKVPADASEYQNGQLADANFVLDRALQTVGSASVNGDNYGTGLQMLKGVVATLTDSGHVAITVKIDMGADALAAYSASSLPRYELLISTQKYGIAINDAANDLVTLKIDLNTFNIITSDLTMIVIDKTAFIRHPEGNVDTDGVINSSATLSYDASAWTGGSASFNLTASLNFTIGGLNVFSSGSQSTINGAMVAIAAAINVADPTANAVWNNTTKIFTMSPAGAVNTDTLTWSSTGGGHPTIFPLTGLLLGADQIDVFPQDEIVISSNFYIESNTRLLNIIKLTDVQGQIIAKNGSKSFILDSFNFPLASIPLTGYTQQFDDIQARVFNVPATSIRKFIEVKRRNDLDDGTRKYFQSNYAIMWRWETWTQLLGVDIAFFDSTKPNNGFNHWWYQYAQVSGWTLNYNLIIQATKDGIAQQYTHQELIIPHDYASNSAYTVKDILCFDPNDLTKLLSGSGGAKQLQTGGSTPVTINGQVYYLDGNNVAFSSQKTLMVAIFTKTSLPTNVNVEMKAEVYQQGGIAGERVLSSKWVTDGNTWFSSIDGSDKVVLYAYGDSIIALAYFDPNEDAGSFPLTASFISFVARIYEVGLNSIETDDGIDISTDGGTIIIAD